LWRRRFQVLAVSTGPAGSGASLRRVLMPKMYHNA
jgi:hypothetical protein